MKNSNKKILLFDIETAPIIAHVWAIWDQNIGLNQIEKDWHILSWSAKWLKGSDGVTYGPHNNIMYQDQRKSENIENDKELLKGIWKLLDEADIIITQNGKKFDIKKLNARFIQNKLKPYSTLEHIDTCQIARDKFGFTSNKLEYLCEALDVKRKKLKHKKFPGHELWKQCLKNNKEAWKEMERYNKQDVLALEEVYLKLEPWAKQTSKTVFNNGNCNSCNGKLISKGFRYTAKAKYQRYVCKKCGSNYQSSTNLLDKKDRKNIKVSIA